MPKKNKERVKATSCGALAWRVKDGCIELLLIKQFSHQERWGIPKGHLYEGETLEQCAIRETREETGVICELGGRLPDTMTTYKNEDKTVVSWLAKVLGDDTPNHADPDSEVADARWFRIDELPEIHMYQRQLISTAVTMIISALDERK